MSQPIWATCILQLRDSNNEKKGKYYLNGEVPTKLVDKKHFITVKTILAASGYPPKKTPLAVKKFSVGDCYSCSLKPFL